MRPLIVVRPEPGASATAARARALGLTTDVMPLFAVGPLPWSAPPTDGIDALLLTSANAPRCGGPELDRLKHLPVVAVGAATAAAARDKGFAVTHVGTGGVDALLAELPPTSRLLHLTGRDRRTPTQERTIDSIAVYDAVAIDPPRDWPVEGRVVALHSPRAGARFADLAADRGWDRTTIAPVALSGAVAEAAGGGWETVTVAGRPDETAMLALAAELCLDRRR